jgi:hypothetical protein
MRVIEKQMIEAIKDRRPWKSGNTEVSLSRHKPGFPGGKVWLHGNLIALVRYAEDHLGNIVGVSGLDITLAGRNTPTTRSRLNALIKEFGTMDGISTFKGQAMLYRAGPDNAVVADKPITSNEWVTA